MGSKVSIIVPCFKQAQYLSEALQSVLEQTFADWECIIVNDGSPDNTDEIARQWCEKDMRFKYLKKKNGGLSSARNAGIATTTGKYILPLDADDKIAKKYLEKAVNILNKNREVELVYGEAEYFGETEGRVPLSEYTFENMVMQNVIYCSAIFRRDSFIKAGPYCEELKWGLEDWDLWLRLLNERKKVVKLSDVVFFYRYKRVSMLNNFKRNAAVRKKTYDLIFKRNLDVFLNVIGNPIFNYREQKKLREEINSFKNTNTYKILRFFRSFRYGRG